MRTSHILRSLLIASLFTTYGCMSSNDSTTDQSTIEEDLTVASDDISPAFSISFSSTPPKDLAANATPEELIQFAWEEFIALTWKSSYAADGKRDNPDTTWNWQNYTTPYPDLVVWETYAHRTELRPADDRMQAFDSPPRYSFVDPPQPANPGADFTLFNNLDENNEIGSCDLYAHYGTYGKEDMVLYQAKVNRDEYDYIRTTYPTKAQLLAATTQTKSNIATYKAYYQGATGTCDCPAAAGVVCLPCGGSPVPATNGETYTGAMEVKTAWRKLTAEDDPSLFFVRNVVYYEAGPGGAPVYNNADFALIGIHIIHKTTNFPGFVFATWEHVGVTNDDMAYELLDGTNTIEDQYQRFHPIPAVVAAANDAVHAQMKQANPNTIWTNYQLIGVQGQPTNDSTSFSYFLANYVIESDPVLADFHGSGIDTATAFDGKSNLLVAGELFTMGGCKGCHGAAQLTLGTDLSFLLDTVGKPVPQPDVLELPTITHAKSQKLAAYINAMRR